MIDEQPDNPLGIGFMLGGEEYKKYLEWYKNHHAESGNCKKTEDETDTAFPHGAIDGHLEYRFTPTGLGTVIVIRCCCGEEVDVTDFERW